MSEAYSLDMREALFQNEWPKADISVQHYLSAGKDVTPLLQLCMHLHTKA